jgi:hypothetical protein
MSTPPSASVAHALSTYDRQMLEAKANNSFMNQAGEAILNAIDQGLFWVVLTTFESCEVTFLQLFFEGLGFRVTYPDGLNPNLNPYNPAQLFGWALVNYWARNGAEKKRNPVRLRLEWVIIPESIKRLRLLRNVPEYESLTWADSLLYPLPENKQ